MLRTAEWLVMAETVVRGACHHDCPDTCAWEVTVRGGMAVGLRGDPTHPFTGGQLCPKVNPYLERVYHPDRLLRPLRRVGPKGGGRFEPVSWEAAIAEIAERLSAAVSRHGSETVLPYSLDGTQGLVQKGVMADRFFAALGASRLNRHICGVTAWLGASDVLGTPLGIDPTEIEFARTIVLWGTNTLLTNRHLWPYIESARAKGASVIVVDPVRTMTAARADQHVQPRPGTDVALVLALIAELDRLGAIDADCVESAAEGWPELRADALAMSLAEAERITGIDADTVRGLAARMARGAPVALRVLVGMEHREHGRDLHRAVASLAAVTGAARRRGGGLIRSTQVYFDTALADLAPPAGPQRAFNMSSLGEVLSRTAEDPLLPDLARRQQHEPSGTVGGPAHGPPVTALVVYGCNPAATTPDQNRVIAGLERDDLFTVVIEQFMTDTARYADIVLPTTTQIEQLDLMNAWGHLYVSLNLPAVAPVGDCLPNTEIFRRLAAAIELDAPGLADSDEQMARDLLASGHPWLEGITYERLERDGWARLAVPPAWSALSHREMPQAAEPAAAPFPDVASSAQAEDAVGVGQGRDAGILGLGPLRLGSLRYRVADESPDGARALAERFPLALMSLKQHQRFLNSHYGGFEPHLPEPPHPQLEISICDAEARGIADGDEVRVFNDRGELTLRADVSERLQPGLVAVPFGWWAGSPDARTVNVLTNPSLGDPDPAVGSPAFHDTLVEVERRALAV